MLMDLVSDGKIILFFYEDSQNGNFKKYHFQLSSAVVVFLENG